VTPALSVQDLSFGYRQSAPPIFSELHRDFTPGRLTAVTGPSGSGKSTLLYVLGLMLTPTSGTVSWAGEQVTGWRDSDRSRLRAQSIGFVFQDSMLDPARTALGNVMEAATIARMPRPAALRETTALLRRFGLESLADHRPGEVSGGQAQRIALCRALVKRPSLILADEPTGNLDTESAEVVWQALYAAAADGATVVVATHDQLRAECADELLVIGA